RPDIASVDQNGVIVALAAGQGTVQVTSSTGLTATAPVVVQPSDIAIQEPSPVALGPNAVDTLHVIVPGQGGRVVSPLTMQWSSADPNVARVSLTGVVTAVAPGKTTLSVSGLLQTKTVDIVVHRAVASLQVIPTYKTEVPLPIQGTVKFQATALAADGTPVPEAPTRRAPAAGRTGPAPRRGTVTRASPPRRRGVSGPRLLCSCRGRSCSRARARGGSSSTRRSARTSRSCAKYWMTRPRPPTRRTRLTARASRSCRPGTASPRST